MPLSYPTALLIACKALQPFKGDLLKKDNSGNVIVKPGAEGKKISTMLAELHQNDVDFGLHAIEDILDALRKYCRDEQYSLAMGPNELLDSTLIKTVKSLANWLVGATSPLVKP